MADLFGFVQTVVEQENRAKTWHKIVGGEKVPGDHKATETGTREPDTIALVGGKINQSLRNFKAKKGQWDYPSELLRYINMLHSMGGELTANQRLKLSALAMVDDRAAAIKEIADSYRPGSVVSEIFDANSPEGGPQIAGPETPRRAPLTPNKEAAKKRKLDFGSPVSSIQSSQQSSQGSSQQTLETVPSQAESPFSSQQTLETVPSLPASQETGSSQSQVESPFSSQQTLETVPSLQGSPAIQEVEPMQIDPNMSAATAPLGGGDASGSVASGEMSFRSYPMRQEFTNDGINVYCGGTRVMYTWAYQMSPHNLDGTTNASDPFAAGVVDYYPVAHRLPWEWIPFYMTPAEWDDLLWNKADISVKHVRVRVTPLAKESQFSTSSTSTDPVSNEHLVLGKRCVGFNHKWPGITMMRNYAGNITGNTMQLSKSGNIDWAALRQKIWGDCSDWTSGQMVANKQSCMELFNRELECLDGVIIDAFDKTTRNNNTRNFGAPRFDQYFDRFNFMAAIGKPIIDEIYKPKHSILTKVPFRKLHVDPDISQFVNSGNGLVFARGYSNTVSKNRDNGYDGTDIDHSENFNIGATNLTGGYHSLVEQMRTMPTHCEPWRGTDNYNPQPSISFGMCPIMPIDPTQELPKPIQARAMWKIDYEICIHQKPHAGGFPYATYCMPTQTAGKTRFPPNTRVGTKPNHIIFPLSYDATNTAIPDREQCSVTAGVLAFNGRGYYRNVANTGVDTVAGSGYTDPCVQSKDGLQLS